MKKILLLLFLVKFLSGFSQPPPNLFYPERIKSITEKLKTDSLNYELIWERLTMMVSSGFPSSPELNSFKIDSNKVNNAAHVFKEINSDFTKIYKNYFQAKNFKIVDEGDFYLNRVWFYFNVLEFDKAIEDAKYLRDFASYSNYSGRSEYYNRWAYYSLFNLYVIKGNYNEALETLNTSFEKERNKNLKAYYTIGTTSMLSYMQKIHLFEHFNKREELILFLKEFCLEHFEWYFEKAKQKDTEFKSWWFNDSEHYSDKSDFLLNMDRTKDRSFQLLKLLVSYMRKYNDKELPKYEKIYHYVRYSKTVNFETINPKISDKKLKKIIRKMS